MDVRRRKMKASFLLVRQWSLRVAIAALTLLLTTPSAIAQTGSDFSLVIFPDTQNEAQYYPAVYTSQTQWIANNKTSSNIVFATHVGDIVNTATSAAQWNNADASMDILDAADVAYSVGPGNHDVGTGSLYETYFGVSRFSGKSWYGGHYGSDNYNNYSLFSASGMDFILINLEYNAATARLNWADDLLKTYSSRRGIVVQHDILNTNNSWYNQAPYTALKDNPNLFLMLCGHMHTSTDGAAYRAELGDDGHTIHIMLADYQDFPNGGNGYLRILRFSPASNMIYATTYSPYLDSYITTSPDQMNMTYSMSIMVSTKAFLQGPYDGDSMNTTLNANLPTSHPYGVLPWNYEGPESVESVPSGVVDWVLVELRTDTTAASNVGTRAAFIKGDGSIVDLDGVSPVAFTNLSAGNYYIVIRHRNHLAVMSASAVALSETGSLYDFTTSQSQAYGTNPMKLVGTKYTMYAGDGNQSGIVTAADANAAYAEINTLGYNVNDINLSGIVTAADANIIFANINKITRVP
jgi:hypothetical protein